MGPVICDASSAIVVEWIGEAAVQGVFPMSGGRALGYEYLLDGSYAQGDARAEAVLRRETTTHCTPGFLAGIAAMLNPPRDLPATQAAAWIVQARVAAAVATIYHHEVDDPAIRMVVVACLLRERIGEPFVDAGASRLLPQDICAHIRQADLHKVSARTESLLLDMKDSPVDVADCRAAGETAVRVFRSAREAIADAGTMTGRSPYWEPPS